MSFMTWAKYAVRVPTRAVAMVTIPLSMLVAAFGPADPAEADSMPWLIDMVAFVGGVSFLWMIFFWNRFWRGAAVQRRRIDMDKEYSEWLAVHRVVKRAEAKRAEEAERRRSLGLPPAP